MDDFKKRVNLFIEKLIGEKFKKILLVTHDGVVEIILSEYFKNNNENKHYENSSDIVYKLDIPLPQ